MVNGSASCWFAVGTDDPENKECGDLTATRIFDEHNVMFYGAKGDGVTDDTVAFQSALSANEYGPLYIPEGVFLVGPLIVSKPVTIQGSGRQGTVIRLAASSSGPCITVSMSGFVPSPGAAPSTVVIQDITIDSAGGKSDPAGQNVAHGLYFNTSLVSGSTGLLLNRVTVTNMPADGFNSVAGNIWATVSECIFLNNGRNGFTANSNSDYVIENSAMGVNVGYGFVCSGCNTFMIQATAFYSNSLYNIYLFNSINMQFSNGACDRSEVQGLFVTRETTASFFGMLFGYNGLSAAETYSDVHLDAQYTGFVVFSTANFVDPSATSAQYSITFANASSPDVVTDNCNFAGSLALITNQPTKLMNSIDLFRKFRISAEGVSNVAVIGKDQAVFKTQSQFGGLVVTDSADTGFASIQNFLSTGSTLGVLQLGRNGVTQARIGAENFGGTCSFVTACFTAGSLTGTNGVFDGATRVARSITCTGCSAQSFTNGVYTFTVPSSSGVTSVSGTANEISSTGGTTPVLSIASAFNKIFSSITIGSTGVFVMGGTDTYRSILLEDMNDQIASGHQYRKLIGATEVEVCDSGGCDFAGDLNVATGTMAAAATRTPQARAMATVSYGTTAVLDALDDGACLTGGSPAAVLAGTGEVFEIALTTGGGGCLDGPIMTVTLSGLLWPIPKGNCIALPGNEEEFSGSLYTSLDFAGADPVMTLGITDGLLPSSDYVFHVQCRAYDDTVMKDNYYPRPAPSPPSDLPLRKQVSNLEKKFALMEKELHAARSKVEDKKQSWAEWFLSL
jgi:hypothetical protein